MDEEDRQERVPEVVALFKSNSSWVCRYQVAQLFDGQLVQRIASERMALSCLVTAVCGVTQCTIQMRY